MKRNMQDGSMSYRAPDETLITRLMFEKKKCVKVGHNRKTVYEKVINIQKDIGVSTKTFLRNCYEQLIA